METLTRKLSIVVNVSLKVDFAQKIKKLWKYVCENEVLKKFLKRFKIFWISFFSLNLFLINISLTTRKFKKSKNYIQSRQKVKL